MPIACPRCSTVGHDGQAFCVVCGAPLAAAAPIAAAPVAAQPAAPAGAPLVAAQPVASSPAFPALAAYQTSDSASVPPQSPFYAPPPAPPPSGHRPSTPIIVGGVFGALAFAAIVGIVLATFHPTGSTAAAGPVGQATPSAVPTSAPATPAPSASAAPSAQPTPTAAPAGNVVDEKYLTVPVPDGYTVKDHTPTTVHLTSADGDVYIDTGTIDPSDPAATLPGLANQDLVADQKYSSDAKICVPAAAVTLGSQHAPSQTVTICGNWTPTQGAAFPFADGYNQGLSMYQGKPLIMRIDFFCVADKSTTFFKSSGATQILTGTVFKLYGAS